MVASPFPVWYDESTDREGGLLMKCNHCGCNYDDADKECPMCGTKAGQGTRASVPRYVSDSHTTHGSDNCTHQTFTREESFSTPRVPRAPSIGGSAERSNPKNRKGGFVAVIVAILLAVGAPALNLISDALNDFSANMRQTSAFPNGENWMLDGSESSSEMLDYSILGGKDWVADTGSGGKVILAVASDDTYTLAWNQGNVSYVESGEVYMWLESDDFYYSEDYPADEYQAYTLNLERTELKSSTGTLPVSLMPKQDRDLYMNFYHKIGAPDSEYIILSEFSEGAPIFPDAPVTLTQVMIG